MFSIQIVQIEDVLPTMLDSFDRSQMTTKVLLNDEGRLIEKEDVFQDDWTLERKREIVQHFKQTIEDGGAVIVAKQGIELIGFAVVEAEHYGNESLYRELSFLHVTRSTRGQKVGKQLFQNAKKIAKSFRYRKTVYRFASIS